MSGPAKVYNFKIRPTDKELIKASAAARGLTPSELIRESLRAAGVPLAPVASRPGKA